MAKNVFVGDSNGKAQKVSKIYVGGSDGKAHKVKAAYVGDANGKARKFWPTAVLPERYQQILYLGYTDSTRFGGIAIPSPSAEDNPRIVAVFKPKSVNNINGVLFSCYANMDQTYSFSGWTFSFFNDVYSNPDRMEFDYGVYNNQGYAAFKKDTSGSGEGVLYDQIYSIDFNKIANNYSYFYLYCTDGYYSLSSHNLIGSIAKQTFSKIPPYNQTPKFKIFNSGSEDTYGVNWGPGAAGFNIYSFKMYNQSGGLLRNFYPCRDTNTGNYGLYDLVNRVFFSTNNSSSTDMDVGPEYNGEL